MLVLTALLVGTGPWRSAEAEGKLLASAACGLFASLMTTPAFSRPDSLAPILLWSSLCAGALSAVWGLFVGWTDLRVFSLAGALLLVLAFFSGLQQQLSRHFSRQEAAALVLALALFACGIPLILAPLAAQHSDQGWLIWLAANVSPLSYMAGVIDYDYLRDTWFYDHVSLGSMRFDYAPTLPITALWMLLILITRHRARLPEINSPGITRKST